MEWFDLVKDAVVLVVVPVIYWLRMLISKQEETSKRLANIAEGLAKLETLHGGASASMYKSVSKLTDHHHTANESRRSLEKQLSSVESKLDLMLSAQLKKE